MMNPRQLSTLTPALLWVVFAAAIFGLLAMGSDARQTAGAATPQHQHNGTPEPCRLLTL